jgi:hypothetical protein
MKSGGTCLEVALAALFAMTPVACGDDRVPAPLPPVSVGPIDLEPGIGPAYPARSLGVADERRFTGVALSLIAGNGCSGAFVVASESDVEMDGPAYFLSAGHCTLEASTANPFDAMAVEDQGGWLKFRWFEDSRGAAIAASVAHIDFVTMKGTDLALAELSESRSALRRRGVVPFVLADQGPAVAETLVVVGHPSFGFAQMAACPLRARVPLLVEGAFHWYDANAHACEGIDSGSSGSPVFSAATGKVVAVLNTLAEARNSARPCTLNHPCEGSEDPELYAASSSYSMDVTGLGACFDQEGRFDRGRPACPLDRGIQMTPKTPTVSWDATPAIGGAVDVPLDPRGLSHYRWKAGAMAATDCRSAIGYGDVVAWAGAPSIHAEVPGVARINFVCLQAGDGPDPNGPGWQSLATPTVLTIDASR